MIEHSPTPWTPCHHLSSPAADKECPCGYRGSIWGADGEHVVCEMGVAPTPGEEALQPPRYPREVELANAAFIIRACNAHDALVAALKAKLDGCLECRDAALLPGEVCSDECAAMATALEMADTFPVDISDNRRRIVFT